MKIAMYGGFPPPICGQSLSNKVLFNYLRRNDYKVDRYNTIVDFNEVGKFRLKKIKAGLELAYKFYKKSDNIDIVYTTMSQSKLGFLKFYPMFKICQKKNIPYIIHLKGNLLPKTFNNAGKIIQGMILNVLDKSEGVILLSELLQNQQLYQSLSSPTYTVRNFVESDYFISYKKKRKIINNAKTINLFYLSNLMGSKGILDVLKAALILKRKGINFKLKIAGLWKDDIKSHGEKLIKELGEEYVEYLGFVDGDKKKDLIANSHIFLLPTYYPQEGQPISILEAMAGGNVILTTKHSGIPDIVNHDQNGFFVEKKSPESIVEKVQYLYSNNSLIKEIAQNNISEAKGKYTVERFGSEIEDIISGKK